VAEDFQVDVVERGTFAHDWFTVHIPEWDRLLARFEGRAARVLELGSYEGLSACYVLWRLRDAHVTCVDTFTGYWESEPIEARFDENVALVDASRVRKLVGPTHAVLPELNRDAQRYDFIYVDASHEPLEILADLALSWQLLVDDGLMIVDDVPRDVLDAFLRVVVADLHAGPRQPALTKRSSRRRRRGWRR
jgi:predicted O-methyltransferase YrrM